MTITCLHRMRIKKGKKKKKTTKKSKSRRNSNQDFLIAVIKEEENKKKTFKLFVGLRGKKRAMKDFGYYYFKIR